ncbi:hypothetical protein DL96DRAFT_703877 [Flagelloscypha sp. PMI_526]|nr:hypothetical protein DL96DRAFT_703877 [Flagelloscypha sp. PMI_526]
MPIDTQLIHSTQFWLSQGDIVLKLQDKHAFKIPRLWIIDSRIIRHALEEVEEKILISPRSRSTQYDGCPKVTLTHDTLQDWNDTLCLLSDPHFFNHHLGANPWKDIAKVFRLVSGVLRISTKYGFRSQRKAAIALLSLVIPTGTYTEMLTMNSRNPYFRTNPSIPHEVIYLCRELHIGKFLPWALYELSRSPISAIAGYHNLNGNDRAAILAGRDVVLQMQRDQIYRAFTSAAQPSSRCSSGGCRMNKRNIQEFGEMLKNVGPLVLVDSESLEDPHLCSACLDKAKRDIRDGQRRLWEALPSIFGQGSWHTLYQMDSNI